MMTSFFSHLTPIQDFQPHRSTSNMTRGGVQTHLGPLVKPSTILLGNSIGSDLHALRLGNHGASVLLCYFTTPNYFQARTGMTYVQVPAHFIGLLGTIPRRMRVSRSGLRMVRPCSFFRPTAAKRTVFLNLRIRMGSSGLIES
jgi:hypothetical protein